MIITIHHSLLVPVNLHNIERVEQYTAYTYDGLVIDVFPADTRIRVYIDDELIVCAVCDNGIITEVETDNSHSLLRYGIKVFTIS